MAEKICSNCGYEGRGKRPGGSGGGLFRVLGILTMLPFHSLWKLFSGKSGNQCPHCQMPTMVKLNSDMGRLARRKMDIELGLIKPRMEEQKQTPTSGQGAATFGNERPAVVKETKKPVNPEEW